MYAFCPSRSRTRAFLFLFFWSQALLCLAQTPIVTLTGTVVDEKTGAPLPGANVYINNSSIGTTTNEKGTYTLPNLPIGNLEVVVSLLSYTSIK